MTVMKLLSVALLLGLSQAFPSRPGSCNSPPFEPTSNHVAGSYKGGTNLSNYGIKVSIGTLVLSPSKTSFVKTGRNFQVRLSAAAGKPYRGFLIKMYKPGKDLTGWLDYNPKDFLVIQNLLTCDKLKAASLAHHAADAKTSNVGSMTADEVIQDIIMEVTVVVNNSYTIPNSGSEWYASTFKISTYTDNNIGTFCFPGDATVEVQGKGAVPMKNLTLGENVLVEGNKYEPIYSFGHSDVQATTDYVQLTTKSTKLALSEDHMVFVDGGRAVPAVNVAVGDNIVLASGEAEPVKSIDYVIRQGAYAPFTASGSIVVNGVKASSYVSYQESEYLKIAGMSTGISYQWLAHTFELPHRMWCNLSAGACKRESYTEHGVSTWVAVPHMMMQWLVSQNAAVMVIACIPVLVVLVGLWMAVACPLTLVALFVGARFYSAGRLTRKVV